MKKKMNYLTLLLAIILMVGCTNTDDVTVPEDVSVTEEKTDSQVTTDDTTENSDDEPVVEEAPAQQNNEQFSGYKLIEVDGGDLSGYRQPNVVVDIGFGDREYWAFTNEHGQLVRVIAD